MTATLLISKFRAQKALMRFDFAALQELEPVKILSLHFFFHCNENESTSRMHFFLLHSIFEAQILSNLNKNQENANEH